MNNFIKNILLFVAALVLSYFTAEYFGSVYASMFGSGSAWIGSESSWNFIIGFPFAYIFFLTLIFKSFAWGNKNKWIGWLLVPPFLFFVSGDLKHIYLPIILALIALGLAALIQKFFK